MENRKLRISIITVSYNAASTIEQTISSVVNQSYPHIEYIIIDGGSTDGTVDIIKKYKDKIAYWISEPDGGIYDAMNKGMSVATGDYVYFLGADDTLLNMGTIENVISEINQSHADIYSYGVYLVRSCDNKQRYVGNEYAHKCEFPLRMIPHQGMFVKTILAKNIGFDIKYRIAADHKFFLCCKLKKDIKIIYSDKAVAFFSQDGMSGQQVLKNQQEVKSIFKELSLEYPVNNSNFLVTLCKNFLRRLGLYSFITKMYDEFGWRIHKCNNAKCRWCGRT